MTAGPPMISSPPSGAASNPSYEPLPRMVPLLVSEKLDAWVWIPLVPPVIDPPARFVTDKGPVCRSAKRAGFADVIEPLLVRLALVRETNAVVPLIVPLFVIAPVLLLMKPVWTRIAPLVPPLMVPALLMVPPPLRIIPNRWPSMVPPAALLTVPICAVVTWSSNANIEMPSAPPLTRPEISPLLVTVPPPMRRTPSLLSPMIEPVLITVDPIARLLAALVKKSEK